MSDLIRIETIDTDGAVQEAAEATRKDFLRTAGVAGAGFVAGGVLFNGLMSPAEAAISTRRRSKANDVKILNYALTLEYLEAEFYAQAVKNKAAGSNAALARFAEVVADHEAAHVKAIKAVLGRAAVKKPRFDFGNAVTSAGAFASTAEVLEDTGVAAYAGQGPNILQKPVVVTALSIHSVEARHAAWIRCLRRADEANPKTADLPAPAVFDDPKTEKQILAAVTKTGFIQT